MTDKKRIEQLEIKVASLEARIATLEGLAWIVHTDSSNPPPPPPPPPPH